MYVSHATPRSRRAPVAAAAPRLTGRYTARYVRVSIVYIHPMNMYTDATVAC